MRYGSVEKYSEAVDTLACIVLGYDTVQKIMGKLKQPQSTVSMKLSALRRNKIVKKNKWTYEVNWSSLLRMMRNDINEWAPVDKKFLNNLFDDNRLKRIMVAYAEMVVELHQRIVSIHELMWRYLLGVSQTHSNELKRIDKKLVKLKKVMAMSEERYLFLTSEDVTDNEKVVQK